MHGGCGSARIAWTDGFISVVGVGSVTAMLAIGDGAKQLVLNRISPMGTTLLLMRPGPPVRRGVGGTVADNLFAKGTDPVGQYVVLNSVLFQVLRAIGVAVGLGAAAVIGSFGTPVKYSPGPVLLAAIRYREGVDDSLTVLDAQRTLFQADDQRARSAYRACKLR
jgi:hypothetical protein